MSSMILHQAKRKDTDINQQLVPHALELRNMQSRSHLPKCSRRGKGEQCAIALSVSTRGSSKKRRTVLAGFVAMARVRAAGHATRAIVLWAPRTAVAPHLGAARLAAVATMAAAHLGAVRLAAMATVAAAHLGAAGLAVLVIVVLATVAAVLVVVVFAHHLLRAMLGVCTG